MTLRNLVALIVVCGLLAGAAAAATPPAIADFGKLPAVEQMRLSPSGEMIAYIAVVNDQRRVVLQRVDGPQLFAVNVGALKLRRLAWLGDGHVLIEASKTLPGDPNWIVNTQIETFQSTIINAANGKLTYVFHGEFRIFPATFGFYGYASEGATQYGYFGGLTLGGGGSAAADFDRREGSIDHGFTDLYRVDLDTGGVHLVAAGSEVRNLDWVVDAAGAVAAHAEYNRQAEWRLYADPADRTLIAEAPDPIGDIGLMGLGRTPGSVIAQRPAGPGGDFTILEYQTKSGATGAPVFGDDPVRAILTDPATGLLIGGVTNDDDPRTIVFDPALQAKFDKVQHAFPGEVVTLASATRTLDRMILFTHGPGDSGTYFLVDYPTKKIHAVGWEYPTILQAAVGAVKVIVYRAADGLEMQGVLTLPPGREAKALPLVVLPHGGPEARDYARFDWWAQAFASRGYAVFQPNFRGSAGFGRAFRDAGHGQWGRKMQTDVSDGVAELARRGIIDPKRACIVGASYGGYVALAGVTVQQGLYKCAVAVGGVSDLNAMLAWEANLHREDSLTMRYWHLFMGVQTNGDATLNAYSPRKLADRADAPVLLIFGKDDTVVPNDQSLSFASALRGAGKPVEVLQLPDEDHWLSREATRTRMLEASVAFVEKYNPPT